MFQGNTEELISLVKDQRLIWDTSHTDYRNRDKRNECWREIAYQVTPNFDDLTGGQQRELIHKILSRWRTVRDAYIRERSQEERNANRGVYERKRAYIYSKHLDFLAESSSKIRRRSYREQSFDSDSSQHLQKIELDPLSSDNDCKSLINGDIDGLPNDSNNSIENCKPNEITPYLLPSKFQQPQDICETVNSPVPFSSTSSLNGSIEVSYYNLLKAQKDEAEDEDRAFFTSLLPTIKQFTIDEKLILRSQILQLVINTKQKKSNE